MSPTRAQAAASASARAPEGSTRGARRHRVAVLTRDPALADVLRDSAPELELSIAAAPADLADLLLSRSCRALVMDAELVGAALPSLVEKLATQFPELPLVAVGARTDEAPLARLLSGGVLYRFLHRPVSPERARAFLAAALRRSGELARAGGEARDGESRRETAPRAPGGTHEATATPPGSAQRNTASAPAARGQGRDAAPAPVPARRRAADAARGTAARGAADFLPGRRGLERTDRRGTLLLGALVLVAVVAGVVLHGSETAHAPPVAATAPAPTDLVAAARDAEARGALVTPVGRSAVDYYREALERAPADAEARDRLLALAPRLLEIADAALGAGRYDEAEAAARAVALVAPERVDVGALVERIELARASGARGGTRKSVTAPSKGTARTAAAPRSGAESRDPAATSRRDVRSERAEPAARIGAADGDVAAVSTSAPGSAEDGAAAGAIPASTAAPAAVPTDAAFADAAPGDRAAGASATAPRATEAVSTDPPSPPATTAAPRPSVIPPPVKLVDAAPDYPARARSKNVEGWVDVTFTIDTSGVPGNVRVMAAQPGGVFEEAAVAAVRRWRYAAPPAPRDTNVRVRFRLDR